MEEHHIYCATNNDQCCYKQEARQTWAFKISEATAEEENSL